MIGNKNNRTIETGSQNVPSLATVLDQKTVATIPKLIAAAGLYGLMGAALTQGLFAITDALAAEKPGSATQGESCLLLVSGQTVWQISVPASTATAPIPDNFCETECDKAMASKRAELAPVKTSGSVRYTCRNDRSTTVSYQPNPVTPTCPGYGNLPTSRQQTCPTGFTGSWTQNASFSQAPSPDCSVTVTWSPTTAPSGSCVAIPVEPPPRTATLSWTPGAAVTGAAVTGYRIQYGTSATALTSTVQVPGLDVRTFVVRDLTPGTYFFAVRAYTADGRESALSNVQSKVVR